MKSLQNLVDQYANKMLKLKRDGIFKNIKQIELIQEFISDLQKNINILRDTINDLDDPQICDYLKNQTDFTEIIYVIARVRRALFVTKLENHLFIV